MIYIELTLLTLVICYVASTNLNEIIKRTIWKWLIKDREYTEYPFVMIDSVQLWVFIVSLGYITELNAFSIYTLSFIALMGYVSTFIVSLLKHLKHK